MHDSGKIKNILVVVAHPDDEVLGCGGTISRLSDEGFDVFIAILGEGITSRYESRDQHDPLEKQRLHHNCRNVSELLNARDLFMFNFPDNRFDTIPLLEVVKIVEQLVQKVKPTAIYTHAGGDLNIDHVITHRTVMTAVRPMADCPVRDVYAMEIPSSTEWTFQQFQPVFKPSVFIDITRSIDNKLEAMALYEGEVQSFPHPRSPDALRALARRWGSAVGVEYAEPFELIRSIR